MIDRVIKVPDIATAATLWAMKEIDDSNYNGDLSCGPTTALAFITALSLAAKEKCIHSLCDKIEVFVCVQNPPSG